jgi:Fe-S cluster assembly iron-binding protein IscA
MINITEIAAKKVKEVLADRSKESAFLRLYVTGFG